MSSLEVTPYYNYGSPLTPPSGSRLELAYSEGSDSAGLFNHYFELRQQAGEVDKTDGEALSTVQESVRSWVADNNILAIPDTKDGVIDHYTTYDEGRVWHRLGALVSYLEDNHNDRVSPVELEATRAFIESSFAMYHDQPSDGEVMADADGSFAFVVPLRMSRNDPEYGAESESVIPALRYLPNEMRAQMMVGLPPFVIDTYEPQIDRATGKERRGYLVLAPVSGDIEIDMQSSLGDKMKVVRHNVDEAVDFAHRRFGVRSVGLGATLPAMTNYGKTIRNKNVITTTGHGGTADFVLRAMERGLQGQELESVGILGLGSIGASLAQVVADQHPNISINVYDASEAKMNSIVDRSEGRFTPADSAGKLIVGNQVVVAAITGGMLDLEAMGLADLSGKLIVDDSQPARLDRAQVEKLGGHVVWPIGHDSGGKVAVRTGYDFGTMANGNTDLFGCEAEAAVVNEYYSELLARGMGEVVTRRIVDKVAIRKAVTPQAMRYIRALNIKYDINASEPQAFGTPVTLG